MSVEDVEGEDLDRHGVKSFGAFARVSPSRLAEEEEEQEEEGCPKSSGVIRIYIARGQSNGVGTPYTDYRGVVVFGSVGISVKRWIVVAFVRWYEVYASSVLRCSFVPNVCSLCGCV